MSKSDARQKSKSSTATYLHMKGRIVVPFAEIQQKLFIAQQQIIIIF
jgi:hypothetical protein